MPFWKKSPIFEVVEEGKEFSRKEDDALYDVEIRVEDDAGGFKAVIISTFIYSLILNAIFIPHYLGSHSCK